MWRREQSRTVTLWLIMSYSWISFPFLFPVIWFPVFAARSICRFIPSGSTCEMKSIFNGSLHLFVEESKLWQLCGLIRSHVYACSVVYFQGNLGFLSRMFALLASFRFWVEWNWNDPSFHLNLKMSFDEVTSVFCNVQMWLTLNMNWIHQLRSQRSFLSSCCLLCWCLFDFIWVGCLKVAACEL